MAAVATSPSPSFQPLNIDIPPSSLSLSSPSVSSPNIARSTPASVSTPTGSANLNKMSAPMSIASGSGRRTPSAEHASNPSSPVVEGSSSQLFPSRVNSSPSNSSTSQGSLSAGSSTGGRSPSPASSARTTVPPSPATASSSTLSVHAPNFQPSYSHPQPFPSSHPPPQITPFQHPHPSQHMNVGYPYQMPFHPQGNPVFFNFPSQAHPTPPSHPHSLPPQGHYGAPDPNVLMNLAYHQQAQHMQQQMQLRMPVNINGQGSQPPSPSARNVSGPSHPGAAQRQRTGSSSSQQPYYFDPLHSPSGPGRAYGPPSPSMYGGATGGPPPPFVNVTTGPGFTPPIPSPHQQNQAEPPFSAYRPQPTSIRPLPNQPPAPSPPAAVPDWKDWKAAQYSKTPAPPQPLYAQHSARGSTSSVNSTSDRSSDNRPLPPGAIRVKPSEVRNDPSARPQYPRARTDSQSSTGSRSSYRPSERERTPSMSSTASSRPPPPKLTLSNSAGVTKPSPLSQQAFRSGEPAAIGTGKVDFDGEKGKPKKTITGKLRRALSMSSLQQMEGGDPTSPSSSSKRAPPHAPSAGAGRRFGLLNSKMNSSTDNISISSTVSSASVMIRKIGNMAKLGRRGSLMSLGSMFNKDKETDNEDGETTTLTDSKTKKKDKKKSAAAIASVSHVTAELDKGANPTLVNGMTPAEALVKKHQAMYAEQEAAAAAARGHGRTPSTASSVVSTATTGTIVGRSRTAEDAIDAAKARAAEKEKDKLKSRKPRSWGFGSFGGSSSGHGAPKGEDDETIRLSVDQQQDPFAHSRHPTRESSASQKNQRRLTSMRNRTLRILARKYCPIDNHPDLSEVF
ncbi:hypothetical protein BT69DRAFT_354384 [Atractiella rhizophila]|nr:hypothetical protein BT69DRAFT_354384 [Atractiella rhizophila]